MSRSTALGFLSKAQTGNDILVCLDVIESLLIDWYHERMAVDSFVLSAAIRYLTVFLKALPLCDARPYIKMPNYPNLQRWQNAIEI